MINLLSVGLVSVILHDLPVTQLLSPPPIIMVMQDVNMTAAELGPEIVDLYTSLVITGPRLVNSLNVQVYPGLNLLQNRRLVRLQPGTCLFLQQLVSLKYTLLVASSLFSSAMRRDARNQLSLLVLE